MDELATTINAGDIIALFSCIISIICALFAFFQVRIAKNDYALQKRIYLDGTSKLELAIRNSFIFDDKKENDVYLFFGIIISNLSDKQTSIKKYVLSLLCEDNIIYKPDLCYKDLELYQDLNYLDIATNIESHNSISGWVRFILPREVYDKINIDMFMINIEDIHGTKISDSTFLVREELNNYEIGKKNENR